MKHYRKMRIRVTMKLYRKDIPSVANARNSGKEHYSPHLVLQYQIKVPVYRFGETMFWMALALTITAS